jgi:hypothetical protein
MKDRFLGPKVSRLGKKLKASSQKPNIVTLLKYFADMGRKLRAFSEI